MKQQRLSSAEPQKSLTIENVLAPERIVIFDVHRKQAVIDRLISLLAKTPEVSDRNALKQAMDAREQLLSTGIGCHIGVPHVRIDSVSGIVMAAGLSHEGIDDYESLDGQTVHLVFAIAAHTSQHKQHINLLAQISRIAKDPAVLSEVLQSPAPADLYARLTS